MKLKIRIFDRLNKKMEYNPNFIYEDGEITSIFFQDNQDYGIEEPEIMVWTGLNDKNKKEIYEGDVVQLMCGHKGRVDYQYDCFTVLLTTEELAKHFKCNIKTSWIGCKVIGNIWEHPHLLTEDTNVKRY